MTKKKRKGGKSIMRTVEKLLGVGVFVAPMIGAAMDPSLPTANDKLRRVVLRYSGFDYGAPEYGFQPHRLMEGWGGYIVFSLVSKGIHKLNGIIRGL